MAKITVRLTSTYDDGKTVKTPGETIGIEEKQVVQLAALGMVELPAREIRQTKGKAAKVEASADLDPDGDDPDAADPSAADLDPDAMGDEE